MKSTNIAMWSGPRNLSTAMMRAFENRADTVVWDEPFYAAYLSMTGMDHPMRDAVIAAGEPNWRTVADQCVASAEGSAVFYQKHMTHHMLPEIETQWLAGLEHGFLLRDPGRVLRSYAAKRDSVTLADIGFTQQLELFERVAQQRGEAPLVVDSDAFLQSPEAHLRMMCTHWGIGFSPGMLAWPAGPRASDGAWAPHWYASVWESTGFGLPRAPDAADLPSHLSSVYDAAKPLYDKLLSYSTPLSL